MSEPSKKTVPLAEMAKRYGKSVKTFKRYAIAKEIPHVEIGPSWYFDPAEVERYMTEVRTAPVSNVRAMPVRKTKARKIVSQRFAEAR